MRSGRCVSAGVLALRGGCAGMSSVREMMLWSVRMGSFLWASVVVVGWRVGIICHEL